MFWGLWPIAIYPPALRRGRCAGRISQASRQPRRSVITLLKHCDICPYEIIRYQWITMNTSDILCIQNQRQSCSADLGKDQLSNIGGGEVSSEHLKSKRQRLWFLRIDSISNTSKNGSSNHTQTSDAQGLEHRSLQRGQTAVILHRDSSEVFHREI